jgi:hypothetical protein
MGPRLASDHAGPDTWVPTYFEEDRNMRYLPLMAAVLMLAACSGGGNGNMTDTSAGTLGQPAVPDTANRGVQTDTSMTRDTSMMRDTSTMQDTSGAMNRDTTTE